MTDKIDDEVRRIVATHVHLVVDVSTLNDHDDLFSVGMSSFASVKLVLALEGAFDIEFPENMLRRNTFESLAAIRVAISELVAEDVVA